MTCGGGALAGLVAPLAEESFVEDNWDRAALVQSGPADRFDPLVTLDEVDRAVAAGLVRMSYVDARQGEGRTWLTPKGAEGRPAVDAYLARLSQGATLVLDGADTALPGLGHFCRRLMAGSGHPWHCNLYVTPPGGQGFDAHFDETGVFICQISGRKTWTFAKAQTGRPLRGAEGGHAPEGWDADAETVTLGPGDLLYLPRGTGHAAEALPGEGSVHVTLTVSEISWAEIAGLDPKALPDPALADLLPPAFHRSEATLAQGLAERGLDAGLAGPFLDDLAKRFQPDHTGRLAAAMTPVEVTKSTAVTACDDLWWRVADREGGIQLITGPIRLNLPKRGYAALEALLTHGGRLGDLPGKLNPAERLALGRVLIDHGLVHIATSH